ncbi:hypothetical protein FRC04_007852 [Tulasnella sp. 424]|nr:hypothetical protein FRC04_007852 [Tulasnella sp. 424]KAG8975036.1 hypothetical protein FRC05_006459 [Tulasnella sp. 425]
MAIDDQQPSASGVNIPPKGLRPSNYLVGQQLDDAIAAGDELEIWWPFEDGKIGDWVQAEALWKHVLFHRLHLRRTLNEFPVLLGIPKPLSIPSYEVLAQLFFERFNVAAFSVNDRAVLQLFAANQISGLVIDIDDYTTDISPIVEGELVREGFPSKTVPVGLQDCLRHLANVLSTNTGVVNTISPSTEPLSQDALQAALFRLAEYLFGGGHVNPLAASAAPPVSVAAAAAEEEDASANLASILVAGKEKALIEANTKKKAAARGVAEREKEKERQALDLIDIEFEGAKLTLGKERHRMCEPLLDGEWVRMMARQGAKDEITAMPIPEAVNFLLGSISDLKSRSAVCDAVQVTGKMSRIKTLSTALVSQLTFFVPRDPIDLGNPTNPMIPEIRKAFTPAKVPEYFANYRDTGDGLSGFLGASIVAKLTFNDPTGRFLSKADYAAKGPSAVSELM